MGTLVIEDIDKRLLDGLAQLAEQNSITVELQVKRLLEQAVVRWDRSDLVARAEAIAAMTPKGVTQTDSVLLLREDRDR